MRRTTTVTITKEGRDRGKVFHLTEMSAVQAEKWAARALLAVAKSGVEVPADVQSAGLAGLAVFGLRAVGGLDWSLAEPLLDEMMTCVKIVRDPSNPKVAPMALIPDADDIEEVSTLLTLRQEILELHLGFSIAERLSASPQKQAASGSTSTQTSPNL